LVLGILVLGGLFVVGYLPKMRNDTKLTAQAKGVTNEVPEVTLAKPRMAPNDAIQLPANIEALASTTIQARTTGYVRKLYVDIGAHVKAGQLLAEIESPDADQQLAQATADTAKSRATVGQSIADVARSQAGVSQSQSDMIRQQATITQTEALVTGAKAKLEQTKADELNAEAKLATAKQAVDVQKANIAQAQAQFDLAAITAKRYEGLLKEGFVAQQDYDQAASTFKTTNANLQAVKANLVASQSDVKAAEQTVAANKAAVHASQSDVASAQANVNAARAVLKSLQSTVDAAKAGVNASQATVSANKEAVNSSVANARRYAVLSNFSRVVAPFDGVITARNIDVGSLVSPGQTTSQGTNTSSTTGGLFGISRVDTLRVFINVPQSNFQDVAPGTKATVRVRELPTHTFEGKVFQSAGALDSNTRTMLTEIRISNSDNLLLPGMYAQIEIAPTTAHESLRVPANTLIVDAKGTRMAVLGPDNKVRFRKVDLGMDYGTEVEIRKGIDISDRLIADPSDELVENGSVTIITPPKKEEAAPGAPGAPGASGAPASTGGAAK